MNQVAAHLATRRILKGKVFIGRKKVAKRSWGWGQEEIARILLCRLSH